MTTTTTTDHHKAMAESARRTAMKAAAAGTKGNASALFAKIAKAHERAAAGEFDAR